ncbi:MAG: hypothetical protein DI538_12855 [Azospira oryzae]|jgi:signal transduction histidine kinase|nr:MAG: hypothetical protein DI538_12855 [Azospira oryzae]
MGLANSFKLRNFLIGEEVIFSYPKFKRIMLTAYLALICMAVAFIYSIVDIANGVYYSWPAYVILFFMPLISIRFIQKKRYKAAKVILMISSNIGVFFAAINDPFETGVFLYFVPTAIGSMAMLEFDERWTGISLAGFTLFLFLLAYFGHFDKYIQPVRPSEFYVQLSLVFNYFFSVTVSVLIIYFLTNLNRRAEKELSEKEELANLKNLELQKVNEELDRFVYSVSHDLRSPLSSILGLTDLARRTDDLKELDQLLIMIQGRVKAQDYFIRDIIDYSRNARTEVVHESVHLLSLVDEALEALRFNTNAQRITFIKQIDAGVYLISDKTRLAIILNNLIGNAIKYHDFSKENPEVEIGYSATTSSVYVRDNGTGIAPQHQQKIFNMFYRGAERSTGSGLGLFITKEAVTKLNGTIEVQSVAGEGSTFTVTFPPRV